MYLKNITAFMTALLLIGSCSDLKASAVSITEAETAPVEIAIEQKILTLSELKNQNYTVPIFITMPQNPGITAMEFGVYVDDRCTYQIITSLQDAYDLTGKSLNISMTSRSRDQFTWNTWSDSTPQRRSGINVLLVMVTVPETASKGDIFNINYGSVNAQGGMNLFRNSLTYVNYTNVSWTDGYIQIAEDLKAGDANGDDKVDITDVILINKAIYNKADLNENQLKAVDLNQDGKPDASDALTIMKYIIRLIDTLESY